MAQDNVARILKQIASDNSTPTAAEIDRAVKTRIVCVQKPPSADDGAAATDTTETPIWINTTGGTVTIQSIKYGCGATGITAGDTHYSTMTIFKRTSSGGTQTSVATATTQTTGMGTLTVGQQASFTLTATIADRTLAAGAVLTYSRTHTMNGLVIPAGVIIIEYTED